ncbi:transcriptional regulator with XRE-family HTH domain [Prauserella isguenensis]|uniref:Transcriptional regulator with XRE-family HTH domain n=1 Tax=Prauserella isguenensis TaxID=1470180 RepID=A0A839RWE1_9PSEU|nr:GntR family transcriptional regulator [Prauserella isguenensis]MBB3049432.1 transcriptional regulator with XRE-family HTH domain [Prauserella isguenensis]
MGTDDEVRPAQVAELVNALVAIREERGLPRLAVAKLMGFATHRAVDRFERHVQDPKFATLLRYADAIGVRVRATVRAPDGVLSPEIETLPDDSTQLSQVQAALVEIRTAQGRTQAQVSERLGCVAHGVYLRERSDDVRLSTLLRYADALGAGVEFSLIRDPAEVAVDATSPGCRADPGAPRTNRGGPVDRIVEDLRTRLEAGEWPPSGCLPSQRALCAEYDCTLPTVRAALSELRALGYISAGFGDHPHVRDRPGEVDLPRALSRLAGQVAERRDTLEARDATQEGWLRDLQRQLVQLSDLAEAREQRQ